MNTSDKLRCPKCNSDRLIIDKKGFSGKNALAGFLLAGGVGILAGAIGSNKFMIQCLGCQLKYASEEHQKKVEYYKDLRKLNQQIATGKADLRGAVVLFGIITAVFGVISYQLFKHDFPFLGTIFGIITILGIAFTIFTAKRSE